MGWLRSIGQWISNAAENIADVVEDVVNAVVEFVSDVVETVGSAIQDVFEWIGDQLGRIPVIGGVLEAIFDWVGDAVMWAFRLNAAAIKGLGSIIGGALAGGIRIIGGILSLNGRQILEGLWDIVSGVLGAIFVYATTLLGYLQTLVFFGQTRSRRLTQAEMGILRRVYGDSIAFNNVRIVTGFSGIYSLGSAAVVFGNTIYFKNRDPLVATSLFVHEACHVWQYQHVGSRYTSDAVLAQISNRGDTEYDWETFVAGGVSNWNDLNREAQADVFVDLWTHGKLVTAGVPATGNGIYYDADGTSTISLMEFPISAPIDRTVFCDEAVAIVRGVRNWRLSAWLS
ncbi:MAG: hypothetical protein HOC77_07595 [Chloroflexi bacterium]|nr:hypothetical protein [Chloroflexota bacterium]